MFPVSAQYTAAGKADEILFSIKKIFGYVLCASNWILTDAHHFKENY